MSMALDFLEEEEESVEIVEGRSVHRTKPRYTSRSPEGLTWEAYFKQLNAPAEQPEDDLEEGKIEEMEVMEPAHELEDPKKAPGPAGTLVRRVLTREWNARVQMSKVRVPAVLYASNSDEGAKAAYNKGDVRYAEHTLEVVCVLAEKRAFGKMFACMATWERKSGGSWKFRGATTSDPYLGEVWRPSKLKPRPQRKWEAEDDVPAPIGLDQWIDIVAPKPAPKRKGKVNEQAT